MRAGERVANDEPRTPSRTSRYGRRVPDDGVSSALPVGEGRPGWHIEGSAMSMTFGRQLRFASRGEDLAFPHHEDGIAWAGAAAKAASVSSVLAPAPALVEGRRWPHRPTSSPCAICWPGPNGREIRYVLLSAHYRETFNFTMEGLEGARTLARSTNAGQAGGLVGATAAAPIQLISAFTAAMDEDL